jgi:hypothetical protein
LIALERAGYSQLSAAGAIVRIQREIESEATVEKRTWDALGAPYQLVRPRHGLTDRSRRTKPKKQAVSQDLQAESIRITARKYIELHPDVDARFESELSVYRSFRRDAEWMAQAETEFRKRVSSCIVDVGIGHPVTINHLTALAELLDDLGQLDESIALYKEAYSLTIQYPRSHPGYQAERLLYIEERLREEGHEPPV